MAEVNAKDGELQYRKSVLAYMLEFFYKIDGLEKL